jgi:hypothetical protein
MIIVSGCPRNGTSMMMRVMNKALGAERILGEEFPQEVRAEKAAKAEAEWRERLSEAEKYLLDNQQERKGKKRLAERAKDMNPNGYYEMAFSVRGVFYTPEMEELLNKLEGEEQPSVCKIVSQGLARSDPRYVSKIVYMVRDPRAVAKSQERLGRNDPMSPEDAPTIDGKKQLIRSVEMYNKVTHRAAVWIEEHSGIPVLVVNYDDMLDDPTAELQKVQDFLGEGDFLSAADLIDTTLRRSEPEDVEDVQAQVVAMELFDLVKKKEWAAIVEKRKQAVQDRKDNPPLKSRWACMRLRRTVNKELCEACLNHPQTVKNFIDLAEKKKWDWKNEPCLYECGIRGDAGMPIEESIKNNHWVASTGSQLGTP